MQSKIPPFCHPVAPQGHFHFLIASLKKIRSRTGSIPFLPAPSNHLLFDGVIPLCHPGVGRDPSAPSTEHSVAIHPHGGKRSDLKSQERSDLKEPHFCHPVAPFVYLHFNHHLHFRYYRTTLHSCLFISKPSSSFNKT